MQEFSLGISLHDLEMSKRHIPGKLSDCIEPSACSCETDLDATWINQRLKLQKCIGIVHRAVSLLSYSYNTASLIHDMGFSAKCDSKCARLGSIEHDNFRATQFDFHKIRINVRYQKRMNINFPHPKQPLW